MPGTISNLNQKIYSQIETWRSRPLVTEYPYVHLDGMHLMRNWSGTIESVAILIALSVNSERGRKIIDAIEGDREDKES